jgi:predicted transcriptional regulator of viral defense system
MCPSAGGVIHRSCFRVAGRWLGPNPGSMTRPLTPQAELLTHYQERIIRRRQLIDAGQSSSSVQRRLKSGEWRRVGEGVYATFTGKSTREAELWTAVLRAGPGAVLSHETAAELHGFAKHGLKIHVTVPAGRRPARRRPFRGVIIHRARVVRLDKPQAPWLLPRTSVEDTVLDLVDVAKTFDGAYSWICDALGEQKTALVHLREALTRRKRIRWRVWLTDALADCAEGINSALERRYARDVERAHRLPKAARQVKRRTGSGNIYLDNLYEDYDLCVELDGVATHPDKDRWKDTKRDNANIAAYNTRTLRFGWIQVTEERCVSAQMVASALRNNGWQGQIHPCGPRCTAPLP